MKLNKKVVIISCLIFCFLFTTVCFAECKSILLPAQIEKVVGKIEGDQSFYFNNGSKVENGILGMQLKLGRALTYNKYIFKNPKAKFGFLNILQFQTKKELDAIFAEYKAKSSEEVNVLGKQVVLIKNQVDHFSYAHTGVGNYIITIYSNPYAKTTKEEAIGYLNKVLPPMIAAFDKAGAVKNTGAEEKIEKVEEKLKLTLENNPINNQKYTGVVADGKSTLKIKIEVPAGYQGKVKVNAPKIGSIEGIEANKEIKAKGDMTFNYIPPQYITEWGDNAQSLQETVGEEEINAKYIPVEIALLNINKDGTSEEIKEEIKVMRAPVVLVHGFTGDKSTWEKLGEHLGFNGYDTVRKEYYYNDATGQSVPAQAHGLSRHIKDTIKAYGEKNIKLQRVDIVAHSMGGLISRYYISQLDNLYKKDVRKLIMVGTPNHGCGDLDKRIGMEGAKNLGKHEKAAEQLHAEDPLILELNKEENNGKHLDHDVQYGICYGNGTFLGDGIVTMVSAQLNGVYAVEFPGKTHSPAIEFWGPSLTTDYDVFKQIKEWLITDIPSGEYRKIDMRIYSVEGTAYLECEDVITLDETSTDRVNIFDTIRTGEDGKVTIQLKIDKDIFGYVDLDKNTELSFNFVSANLARSTVYLFKGSARFQSNGFIGSHFETVLKSSEELQTIKGLDTDYVVTIGDKPQVYCIDGKLEITNSNAVDNINKTTVDKGKGAVLEGDSNITPVSFETNGWWAEEFYKHPSFDKNNKEASPPVANEAVKEKKEEPKEESQSSVVSIMAIILAMVLILFIISRMVKGNKKSV